MGHKSLQVPVPYTTPVLVQSLHAHPLLLLSLAHGQVGQGTGRGGISQNQTGSPSLPPSWGPRGGLEGCEVKPYSVLGMEGGVGHEGAAGECIQNNKTLDLCMW